MSGYDDVDDGGREEYIPSALGGFTRALEELLGTSSDIVYRDWSCGSAEGVVIYVEGLADPRLVIRSIQQFSASIREKAEIDRSDIYQSIRRDVITEGRVTEAEGLEDVTSSLLGGGTVVYLDGWSKAITVATESLKQRNVEEAGSQSVVRGPRESFTESLSNNTALVRRRIQNPDLRMRKFRMGEDSRTCIAVMFVEGKVSDDLVKELYSRLESAKLDMVMESSYLEQVIQDKRYSPFPTVYNSERPDSIAAALMDGRIALFVEGSPFVLVVPALFAHFFQSSEDYYQRSDFASLVRLLRYVCFAVALLTPSFYIAITTYHHEMIPPPLLVSLIGQREGIPFPAFIEALIMEITFEILREAGIRLPKSIGQSVSIVGTLVIGQAAVEAGLISAAMVIVVSITAIANFALPAFNIGISVRMLRFALMAISAAFGLYGMTIALILLAMHLSSLESLGIPYMTSFAPFKWTNQKDVLMRLGSAIRRDGSRRKDPTYMPESGSPERDSS